MSESETKKPDSVKKIVRREVEVTETEIEVPKPVEKVPEKKGSVIIIKN